MNIVIPILVFAGLGIGAGVLLSTFSKVFAVETDPRVEQLKEALPGLNCGACGFSGCESYAVALAQDATLSTTLCTPGGAEAVLQISDILGTEAAAIEPMVAMVQCQGNAEHTGDLFQYDGVPSCQAANLYYGGKGNCNYGCLGFGDCRDACPFGAITVVNDLAVVNPDLCTGCQLCVSTCPKHIIAMQKKSQRVTVLCFSGDTGRDTRQACTVGCIGCKKCEKVCPQGAILVEGNKATINGDLCTSCGACIPVCPSHCIVFR